MMKQNTAPQLPSGVFYLMTDLVRNRERELNEKLAGIGLTLPEWRILRIVHSYSEAIPMSIVIEHSQSDRTTIGRTVEKLVNKGWVQKLPALGDKRAFLVRSLDAVEDVYSQAYEMVTTHDTDILCRLSEEECALLASYLNKLQEGH
ncbi:TPA: MarR family winged helix-turn-helix transcriptional regulator [Klebsiella oxytoca]